MNATTDNNDINIDAGEYVLGTLDDVTRARIERDMIFNSALREQVHAWEDKLQPLADAVDAVQPPDAAWDAIRARTIGATPKNPLSNRLAWWKTLALGGIAASAALAVVLTGALQSGPAGNAQPAQVAQATPPATQAGAISHPVSLAVVNDKKKDPMWVVQCYQQPARVMVSVVPREIPIKDKSLQLWAITKEGKTMFVGVVPTKGKEEIKVDPKIMAHIRDIKAFAVSVEPMGGSPTNKPTGPVNYSGGLLML